MANRTTWWFPIVWFPIVIVLVLIIANIAYQQLSPLQKFKANLIVDGVWFKLDHLEVDRGDGTLIVVK